MLKKYSELTKEQKEQIKVMYSDPSIPEAYLYNYDDNGNYHGRQYAPPSGKDEKVGIYGTIIAESTFDEKNIDKEHNIEPPKGLDKEHNRHPGRNIDPEHDIRKVKRVHEKLVTPNDKPYPKDVPLYSGNKQASGPEKPAVIDKPEEVVKPVVEKKAVKKVVRKAKKK